MKFKIRYGIRDHLLNPPTWYNHPDDPVYKTHEFEIDDKDKHEGVCIELAKATVLLYMQAQIESDPDLRDFRNLNHIASRLLEKKWDESKTVDANDNLVILDYSKSIMTGQNKWYFDLSWEIKKADESV